jgi:hypothetical protein
MNSNYKHVKIDKVTVKLYPSQREYEKIRSAYNEVHGNDNTLEDDDLWNSLVRKYTSEMNLHDVTLEEAEIFAEPIRISHPDQCVTISYGENSFIGYTSWTDQMEMFWEYPVYTEGGKVAKTWRKRIAEEKEYIASYE